DFQVQSVVSSAWYTLTAANLAEGPHCIVYADQNKVVSKAAAQRLVTEYEEKIYPPLERVFGAPPDIDGNGKVILLLLDILDGYTPAGSGYVAGYFSSYHMMKSNAVYPHSNEADMLFLDIYPGEIGSDTFYATIAHELQHLIDFGKTSAREMNRDIWINEGLSLSAEYLYGGQRPDRIDLYDEANAYGLGLPWGNNFFVWNGYWEREKGDSLSNYVTAYLFFQWLRIQAQGTGIYTAISDAVKGEGFGDYRDVTAAAATVNDAFADWPVLLGSWMLANWYNNERGVFGYRGEITLTEKYVLSPAQSGDSYALFPGEGVFSPRGGTSYSPQGNIRYYGVSGEASAAPADPTAGFFEGSSQTGPYLLTFNGNSSTGGGSEPGSLGVPVAQAGLSRSSPDAGVVSLRSSGRAVSPAPPLGPYPVGLGDKLAGHGDTPRPVGFEEARTKGGR
ncbi:MAG: hypothetical protein LBU28_02490, partial [Spirochaetaceae bacterium]|nr:hypothetical protein [Spirochaetaceae bacterium]